MSTIQITLSESLQRFVQGRVAEYSPDFNPIENVFSKLKTMLRKLMLRTVDELWKKLGTLCEIFSPEECQNYFKHAGYYGNTKLQTNA